MSEWVLDQVDFRYKKSQLKTFESIQASFQTGKSYQLTGHSGSGKTTILALLAGLTTCTHGSLTFEKQELAAFDRNHYRGQKVACLFQDGSLLQDSPLANLEMETLLSGEKPDKEALKKGLLSVGLTEKQLTIPVQKLDKKDQQLTALAKLLLKKSAKLLLVDEPEKVFSECGVTFAMERLQRHSQQHDKCLIFTTKTTQSVKFADELWGLNGGKILFIKDSL